LLLKEDLRCKETNKLKTEQPSRLPCQRKLLQAVCKRSAYCL